MTYGQHLHSLLIFYIIYYLFIVVATCSQCLAVETKKMKMTIPFKKHNILNVDGD